MSRNRNSSGFALVAVAVCLLAPSISAEPPGSHLTDAVASKTRIVEDSARDPDRHPAEVLAFFGLEPGMQVADLMGGPGYYAAIMGHAVGSEGKVYLQNNPFALERFWRAAYDEHFANGGLPNVVPWERELDTLGFQEAELDAAFMILFYHDTYWLEVDRAKMNAQILRALKPGGVFGVIDHFAEDGSGERDVKTLHRGDAEQIKAEILAAGFVFDAESELLRHPEDERTKGVFDPSIRGRTDRFVYRFRKP